MTTNATRPESVSAIVGLQWGDEGKGKAVDYLAEQYDIIARAAGGANAGHTIIVGDKKHVFNLLPSGCLHEEADIVLGPGMVIHFPTLLQEIEVLRAEGIDIVPRLYIAKNAHVVLEVHKELDGIQEQIKSKAGNAVGTTKRGIGPAYVDKIMRTGPRAECLHLSDAGLTQALEKVFVFKDHPDITTTPETEREQLVAAQKLLKDRIIDTTEYLHTQIESGKQILIEGAQATLLDIDHGTYPYVTGSSTTTAGALQGLGLAPKQLGFSIGVMKAYCTRVGNGDFPTETEGATHERLQTNGGEFGATTGRPRRCGWLSLPDIKRSIRINGIDALCMTKLDVLDHEDTIYVATAISADGTPTYQKFSGWSTPTQGITEFKKLPQEAQDYVRFVEETLKTPITMLGTGAERDHLIIR